MPPVATRTRRAVAGHRRRAVARSSEGRARRRRQQPGPGADGHGDRRSTSAMPSVPVACASPANDLANPPPGQVVAVGYAPTGVLFAQTREPAALWRSDTGDDHFAGHGFAGRHRPRAVSRQRQRRCRLRLLPSRRGRGRPGLALRLPGPAANAIAARRHRRHGALPLGRRRDRLPLSPRRRVQRPHGRPAADRRSEGRALRLGRRHPGDARDRRTSMRRRWRGGGRCSRIRRSAARTCHSGALFTNNATVDVGTGRAFQVPSLRGVAWRAPVHARRMRHHPLRPLRGRLRRR